MLFLATYEVNLEDLETAMAKRLEWDNVAPESFKIVCEYVTHGKPPPFFGVLVFETDNVDDLNSLLVYYGSSVRFDIRPCSPVTTAIEGTRRLREVADA